MNHHLKHLQYEDGSFDTDSVFITSLILCSLPAHNTEYTEIITSGIQFLLSQRSASWTWNYWKRGSPKSINELLPDDLDDTFCALIALSIHTPEVVTPEVFSHITKTLISQESVIGGPYNTWILPKDHGPQWLDVDIGVNANIAYFLFLHKINPPEGLISYIDECIAWNMFPSKYYTNKNILLYFIARGYTGKRKRELVDILTQCFKEEISEGNKLLLAVALAYLGVPLSYEYIHIQEKIELYTETIRNGNAIYIFSETLLLALHEEYKNLQRKLHDESFKESLYTVVRTIIKAPHRISKLYTSDTYDRIALMPYRIWQSLKNQTNVPYESTKKICIATILGWIAYSIFDDIYDEKVCIKELPQGVSAYRHMIMIFSELLGTEHQHILHEYLHPTDRGISGSCLHPGHKSIAHALGAVTLLILSGEKPNSPSVKHLKKFFLDTLACRQLLDDIHDTEADLLSGRVTKPVTHIKHGKSIDEMIILTTVEIERHIRKAKIALQKIDILQDTLYFEKIVTQIEKSIHGNATTFKDIYYKEKHP